MATESVAKPEGGNGHEFFGFSAKYRISPESIIQDAHSFLDSATGIIGKLCENAEDDREGGMLWGAYFLMQMALGSVQAVEERL